MKIWFGYGSEHSANLVMIGRFKDVNDAAKAKQAIDWLTEQVRSDEEANLIQIGEKSERYTPGMMELLTKLQLNSLGPAELEQFAYDFHVDLEGDKVILRTDEVDVSAFFKVFIDNDARVEIYSAHIYKDDKQESKG
jgi:hypothetical protein